MFGFFKKQAKNANKEHDNSHHGPVVDTTDNMTVSNNDDFSPDPVTSIRRRLEAKVEDLTAQIATKDAEIFKLKNSLGDLSKEVGTKTAGIERVQAELDAAFKEAEEARESLKKYEEERSKNEELEGDSSSDEEDSDEGSDDGDDSEDEVTVRERKLSKEELRDKVQKLQEQLAMVTAERDQLLLDKESTKKEWEEEMRLVQQSLDEAVAQKNAIMTKHEKEYEQLRTVNSDREQQMLDDFEWKLREVEKSSKKRIEEKTKEAERRIKDVQVKLDLRTAMHVDDVEKLKKLESEMTQLKGMSHDQQRLLREAQREHDKLQATIGSLNTEIGRLNAQLEKEKSILNAVQSLYQRKKEERDEMHEQQLQIQRSEITTEVEVRVKRELEQQLKANLEAEVQKRKEEFERELAVEQMNAQAKVDASQRQLNLLRDQMAKKEEQHRREMSNSTHESDSSRLELRRKLDKLDLSYQDKIEALNEAHNAEIEELEKRASQAEMQLVSSKTTLELVKSQMRKDFDERFNDIFRQHKEQLERHRDELQEVHEEQIAAMQKRHEAAIAALCKNKHNGDVEPIDPKEYHDALNKLRKQELMISDLTSTIREQDHALTTLTQEKRELQLQMRSSEETHVCPRCPPGMRNLRRISEHTEPSRDSSVESCGGVRIEEVLDDDEDDDYFEDTMHQQHYLSVVTEEDVSKLSPSPSGCSSEHKTSTSEEDELQVPRDYYVCHSPDQVFPGKSVSPERCRSLQPPTTGRRTPSSPTFCRAVSCPGRWLMDGSQEDDWGD